MKVGSLTSVVTYWFSAPTLATCGRTEFIQSRAFTLQAHPVFIDSTIRKVARVVVTSDENGIRSAPPALSVSTNAWHSARWPLSWWNRDRFTRRRPLLAVSIER